MSRLLLVYGLAASLAMLGFGPAIAAQQTGEQPMVIRAVAPDYPAIAMAAKAEGKVVVEVRINNEGKVTATKVLDEGSSKMKFLHKASEKAASRWQFTLGTDDSDKRTAQLTFVFRVVPDNEAEIFFSPPYQVEVAERKPIIQTETIR